MRRLRPEWPRAAPRVRAARCRAASRLGRAIRHMRDPYAYVSRDRVAGTWGALLRHVTVLRRSPVRGGGASAAAAAAAGGGGGAGAGGDDGGMHVPMGSGGDDDDAPSTDGTEDEDAHFPKDDMHFPNGAGGGRESPSGASGGGRESPSGASGGGRESPSGASGGGGGGAPAAPAPSLGGTPARCRGDGALSPDRGVRRERVGWAELGVPPLTRVVAAPPSQRPSTTARRRGARCWCGRAPWRYAFPHARPMRLMHF